ncbi:unnamed protein product, partial [Mesorhabditis belari]|uniref:ethanolamine kinase n=1 Tax=Mesorhabditis belari TaxID=2138241 RepID=A0AAF3FKK7_9BILA
MANKDICENACAVLDSLHRLPKGKDVLCEKIAGGLTNTMYLIKIDNESRYVFRVNGFGTEKLVDRIEEKRVLEQAALARICPKVIYIDEKVMLQEFCPGRTLGLSSIDDPKIHELIAKKLATFHLLSVENPARSEPWFTKTLKSYLLELNDPKMSDLGNELLRKIESMDFQLTLCHNDLRLNNVIYEDDKLVFIDFEYAAMNFPEYDIAHYFWQHEGAQTASDFRTLTSKDRKLFLSEYLQAYYNVEPSEKLINEILQRIRIFEAANHFLWSVWSLIQHRFGRSDDHFCYIKNSEARFAKYRECLEKATI